MKSPTGTWSSCPPEDRRHARNRCGLSLSKPAFLGFVRRGIESVRNPITAALSGAAAHRSRMVSSTRVRGGDVSARDGRDLAHWRTTVSQGRDASPLLASTLNWIGKEGSTRPAKMAADGPISRAKTYLQAAQLPTRTDASWVPALPRRRSLDPAVVEPVGGRAWTPDCRRGRS